MGIFSGIVLIAVFLVVLKIISDSGRTVMRDPLGDVRQGEAIFRDVAARRAPPVAVDEGEIHPLYCPGCKEYEHLDVYADAEARERATRVWYEEHKPHFQPLPAEDAGPSRLDAPG